LKAVTFNAASAAYLSYHLPIELQSNKEIRLKAAKIESYALESAPKELLLDRDFMMELATAGVGSLERFLPQELKDNFEYVEQLRSISKDSILKKYNLSQKDLSDPEIMLDFLTTKRESFVFEYLPDSLLSDRKFMINAAKVNGWVIRFATKDLQSDKEIILLAIKYNADILHDLPPITDRNFVIESLCKSSYGVLEHLPMEFRKDKEIVKAFVNNSGMALKYAASDLQGDPDIVSAAVANDGWALAYASSELRGRRDIVLEAVNQNGWALNYASFTLKKDEELRSIARLTERVSSL